MARLLKSFFAMLAAALLLPACCPPPKPPRTPPAPISLDDQVQLLARWSNALPRIDAKTDLNGVHLIYRDQNSGRHSENADGHLVIRRHFPGDSPAPGSAPAAAPSPPASASADVYLVGQVYGQTVFEGGRNAQNWWFSVFLDTQTAWVGDSSGPVDLSSLGEKLSQAILRADLVPDLLGLSPLPAPGAPSDQRQIILMRINDFDATNDLFIEQLPDPMDTRGQAYLAKEIRVDRFTGNISEVRLYNPAGIMVVRSVLSHYAPVSYPGAAARPPSANQIPQFPRHVEVSYPAQETTITLNFSDVSVPATLRNAAFETPDFQGEGLKVVPVE